MQKLLGPPKRDLILVGAGHTHIQILRGQRMAPLPSDVRLTVVVDHPVSIYSGMVPGLVAGRYARPEVEIDVRPLARRAGARLIVARALRIDAQERRIHLEGRPPLRYDLASINIGATVAGLDTPGVRQHALPTRPIAALIAALEGRLDPTSAPPSIVVVGGGAGGVELAACLRVRLRAPVTLVTEADRLLPERPAHVGRHIQRALDRRGVVVRAGRQVVEVQADRVLLDGGEALPSAMTLWVTGAAAPDLPRASGLPVDARGFVRVRDTLQVEGHDDLFAAGDCAVPQGWPEIPKAGVYAVRQGPVLMHNLRAALDGEGRALRPYRPQRRFLTLLNLGDGEAVAVRGGLVSSGRALMHLKDRIDRRFMERFQVLTPEGRRSSAFEVGMPSMTSDAEMEMVCGGCAAKVGQTALQRALARLPPAPADPDVVLGVEAGEDVFTYRPPGGGAEVVANLDAFTAFTDDPWLVGRVGALNAMSDLLAKGIAPRYAAAIVTIARDEAAEEALVQVLSGARSALDEAGAVLLGGHTGLGEVLSVGLHVTGFVPAGGSLWKMSGMRPGDRVILTRGLGTGVLWNADMSGDARGEDMQAVVRGMVRGNLAASRIAQGFEVHAATDVTGFGLAGHLAELCRASAASARLWLPEVPALPGALALLRAGRRSTAHEENRRTLRVMAVPAALRDDPRLELLFDPQTAGGLLLATSAAESPALLAALRAGGEEDAAVIAEITEPREDGGLVCVEAATL